MKNFRKRRFWFSSDFVVYNRKLKKSDFTFQNMKLQVVIPGVKIQAETRENEGTVIIKKTMFRFRLFSGTGFNIFES